MRITYKKRNKLMVTEDIPGIIMWTLHLGKSYATGIMFGDKISKEKYPALSHCLDYAQGSN